MSFYVALVERHREKQLESTSMPWGKLCNTLTGFLGILMRLCMLIRR